jgi:hypothetical protein
VKLSNLLEQQGFVSHVPNQGAIVSEPSAKEVEDYYNLWRCWKAGRSNGPRLIYPKRDIERLKSINDSLKRS